jgi:hypothetical protein
MKNNSSSLSPYPTKWGRQNMLSSSILFYHSSSSCSLLLFSRLPSHSPSIFSYGDFWVPIYIHTHYSYRHVTFIPQHTMLIPTYCFSFSQSLALLLNFPIYIYSLFYPFLKTINPYINP